MLTVRNAQLILLAEPGNQAVQDRMVRYVESDFPARFAEWGLAGSRAFVQRGLAVAAANGIDTEGAIAVLLQLMIAFGEQFERSPDRDWACELLAHPTLPPSLKMQMLRQRMMATTQGRSIVSFPHKPAGG